MSTRTVDLAKVETRLRAIIADSARAAALPAEIPPHLGDLARLTRIGVVAEHALAEITGANPIRKAD